MGQCADPMELGRTRCPHETRITRAPLKAVHRTFAETGLFCDFPHTHVVLGHHHDARHVRILKIARRPAGRAESGLERLSVIPIEPAGLFVVQLKPGALVRLIVSRLAQCDHGI